MARTIPAAILAQLTAKTIYPIVIVDMETSAGNVRVWSGIGDLSFGGQTYLGVGVLGGVGPVEESGDEIQANALVLQMSGIPNSEINTVLNTEYRGRPCSMWPGFLNADGVLLDALLLFQGRVDVMAIDEGPETSTISVTVESRLADLDRPRVRRYTDEDQNDLHPGDRGLEYVAGIQNAKLAWGS